MSRLEDVELRIAIAEGVLSREHADALAAEARRKQQSPLALLVERGRLSEESLASLLAEAKDTAQAEAKDATARLDLGTEDTISLSGPPSEVRAHPAAGSPVPGWDRYESLTFLGQGGMGKVFLAFDPRLRRDVAIKFMHGDNPEHVRRLIGEARAQARVSHDRVCKVYEVGEVDGKVYIAMQYIDGQPLGALAGELTVEQKVKLVRGAAEGIHEAHRAGFIHRDVKPANVMVGRSEDGELVPYVMDFGLARSVAEDGVTLTGAVVGTPRYMAPEQAHGDAGKLDRRADVYSLGATLYHLLTGEPPVAGTTLLEVLHNLATSEPRPPRALDPSIPADLEAIVMKCLERDRSARYESARALAEDLGRFLDGEPVAARAAGGWYRVRKRIAKHRRTVAAGAAALVALVVALGWGIQARREAGERERLARRFTELVERIESMARYSALAPAHDIRGDRAAIRARMAELEAEIRAAGAVAAGPGHYALGRGYLALDEDAKARAELEAAWQRGFREPRVAYALALVMGHLYQQNLIEAERIGQRELREIKKREVERQYREPALAYLARSRGAEVPSPEYIAALVAYYGGQLDEALRHLDAIGGGLPWFYEAPELRGDILLARALSLRDQGDDKRARIDFEAGRKAYAAAGGIGESVPAVYESLGELEYAAMTVELYGQGEVAPAFDRTVAATSHALAILPDHYAALVLEARAHRSLAEYRADHGSDTEALLGKAIADAQRAVAADPARPEARLELSRIYWQSGMARVGHNQDPGEQLGKAVAIAEGIRAEDRGAAYYGNLGLIFSVWADYDDQVGRDAKASRGKSIAAYRQALQIDDKKNDVWINLAINYFMRGSQPRADDPDGDLAQAIQALEKALSINVRNVVPHFYEGEIYRLIGERARARGGDPGPDLARSLKAYREGHAISPKLPHLQNGIGSVYLDQAKAAWDRGADPEPLLDQARAAFQQAIAAAPDQGFGYDNVGATLALRASLQRARDEDPSATVQAAVAALNQAIARIPDRASFWADLGAAHATLAAYELEHGRDPRSSLSAASSAIHRAIEHNPSDAPSQRYLGEIRGLSARLRARHGQGQAGDFEAAAEAFQKAIDLAPGDPEYPLALGQFCRAWASVQRQMGNDPGPVLQRGIALADQVLATHPTWPDARILRASLLVIRSQGAPGVAERREQAARAAEDFARALAINPALERAWKNQAALAQQVATGR